MITSFLAWLGLNIDKATHFFAGWAIACMLAPFAGLGCLGVVAVIAMVKECADQIFKTGTPDFYDFAATCLGGIGGFAAWLGLVYVTGYTATFHIPFAS